MVKAAVPTGSRFKGYEHFVVQDLVPHPHVVRHRREHWLTPDEQPITAALRAGVHGHFGAELRRFVLMQHHQGQVTVTRLLAQLRAIGIDVSKSQVMHLLIAGQDGFIDEARDVLRVGLTSAAWLSVDDTGARHRAASGVCTQIGNDHFASFGTTGSKSRLNFLDLLRAGHTNYVVDAGALATMRGRALAGPVVTKVTEQVETRFADLAARQAHLARLGIMSPSHSGPCPAGH